MICLAQIPAVNRAILLKTCVNTTGSCGVRVPGQTRSFSARAVPADFQALLSPYSLRALSKPAVEILWAECKVGPNEYSYFGALCSFFNCFTP